MAYRSLTERLEITYFYPDVSCLAEDNALSRPPQAMGCDEAPNVFKFLFFGVQSVRLKGFKAARIEDLDLGVLRFWRFIQSCAGVGHAWRDPIEGSLPWQPWHAFTCCG